MKPKIKQKLIAPCGMNCNLCLGYLRESNKCPGCRMLSKLKPGTRIRCVIKNCPKVQQIRFCSPKCDSYPCPRLKNLDKRYRTKYGMSMIENLEFINQKGIRKFIEHEEKRWVKGKKIFCVHRKKYFDMA